MENADPKGSSGGSAVLVSSGFAAAALGGDTTGSITWPAGRAACYAMRPTVGLVSTEGCIPLSSSMDVLGPLGKSAYDVALMLSHMARDSNDVSFSEFFPLLMRGDRRL